MLCSRYRLILALEGFLTLPQPGVRSNRMVNQHTWKICFADIDLLCASGYIGVRDDRMVPVREEGVDRKGMDAEPRPGFSVFRP